MLAGPILLGIVDRLHLSIELTGQIRQLTPIDLVDLVGYRYLVPVVAREQIYSGSELGGRFAVQIPHAPESVPGGPIEGG